MTLNEKFDKATDGWFVADKCEEIADEYAIEFALWWVKNNVKILTITPNYTDAEVLQIFKKEKGL